MSTPQTQKARTQKAPAKQRRASTKKRSPQNTPVVHPDAAGIDIAVSSDLWVAVGEHASEKPVRCFSPMSGGLRALCAWLKECRVDTVAMEATGVYWLNLYLELHQAGFQVVVVNPRCVKNLQRKTDLSDAQWLRYLHSVGLLKASFVPPAQILALRTLSRHRENLTRAASEHVQRMQKALDEMNLHLHHVIDDITGTTGRAVIEAILRGERDPKALAALRHRRIKASAEKIEAALEGRWMDEQLFVLGQEYENWQRLQEQIARCEEKLLVSCSSLPVELDAAELDALEGRERSEAATGRRKPGRKPGPKPPGQDPAQWRRVLLGLFGVDLTLTPGVSVLTALYLLCELGGDWSCFPSAGHFASWLGLCPNNQISGGKVLRRSTRTVQNRVRNILKMAAQSLHNSHSHLGEQYRRMRGRLGPAQANTAMAHKLARILWHQVTHKTAYDESVLKVLDTRSLERRKKSLSRMAAQLGLKVVPVEAPEVEKAA